MLENAGENSCDSDKCKSSLQVDGDEEDVDLDKIQYKDIDMTNCNKCLYKDWHLTTHRVKISVYG